jgi:hypothetical protein
MNIRRVAIAFASLIALTGFAAAADPGLTLSVGRLQINSMSVSQAVSVKNETTKTVERAEVECGFFRNNELVTTDNTYVENIAPGETGYKQVISLGKNLNPDRADCRIVRVR